jgi:hypothetical protein
LQGAGLNPLRRRWLGAALAFMLGGVSGAAADPVPAADDFTGDLSRWTVEQQPGGSVRVAEGAMEIESTGGTTVWWRDPVAAPVEISYGAEVVVAGGPYDRLSDLNCFWMAQDPTRAMNEPPVARSGKFSDYDSLHTYYVGVGGNQNTTTRFRRYDGTSARPLLPQHDLREARFLLQANHRYRIRIVVRRASTEYWRDGEQLFAYEDPAPLTAGYFAFRTVRSHLRITEFRIRALGLPENT